MALGKRRAVTGPPPDSRFVVLASLIAKETIPSLREILDLGKELHVARLTHFIPTAFSGTNPQARTRNLLYDAALLNELKTAREVTETRSRLHE